MILSYNHLHKPYRCPKLYGFSLYIDEINLPLKFIAKQGSKEDCKYLVCQCIWNDKDKCSTGILSEKDYNELKDNFKGITNTFNFDECE